MGKGIEVGLASKVVVVVAVVWVESAARDYCTVK